MTDLCGVRGELVMLSPPHSSHATGHRSGSEWLKTNWL